MAEEGALLFFALIRLNKLNYMYQTSLQSFNKLFLRGCDTADDVSCLCVKMYIYMFCLLLQYMCTAILDILYIEKALSLQRHSKDASNTNFA